jgi:hypothetical protein
MPHATPDERLLHLYEQEVDQEVREADVLRGKYWADLFKPYVVAPEDLLRLRHVLLAVHADVRHHIDGEVPDEVLRAMIFAILGAYGLGRCRGAGRVHSGTGETLPDKRRLDELTQAMAIARQ